ncbi:transposable element Tcb1 transposase [Trichonephila clavipes]|uniref:Transposable element Tcb1 transposase n=1 Tax=Trichonephila clavipes TaxID=2585209 RepID=A0A8X6WGW0_TRICX|nr:transposable element Tcb1 transposase [Trichonephila clavipes]
MGGEAIELISKRLEKKLQTSSIKIRLNSMLLQMDFKTYTTTSVHHSINFLYNYDSNKFDGGKYGGARWLVWGIIIGSRTDLHVQSVTMIGHIYQDVLLEQHVRLFRGAMGAEFLFTDDNASPHRANIVDECLQLEDITRMDWSVYSPDLNPIEHVWDMLGRRIVARQHPLTYLPELRGHCLMSGVIFPKIRLII